jgi:hypothetical protein
VTQSPTPRARFALPRLHRPEPAPGRDAAPPAWAEPLFAFIERVDRRRLGIRPVRRRGIAGLSLRRHRGPDVVLRDGTRIREGHLIGDIHMDNARIFEEVAAGAGQARLADIGRADARALVRWRRKQPPGQQPVAFYGATILWPLMRRMGAEVREREQTNRVKWEDWYLRGVLRRWSRHGDARLELGRGELRTMECWISAAEFERRYGTEPAVAAAERGAAAAEPVAAAEPAAGAAAAP